MRQFSRNIKLIGIQFAEPNIIIMPWRNICSADNPVDVLNEHLSLLVGCCVSTKVIRELKNDRPWFDNQHRRAFGLSRRHIFGGARIARSLVNLKEFIRCQVRASQTTRRPIVIFVSETGMFL